MDDINVKAIEEITPYAGPNQLEGVRFRPAREVLGVSSFGMNILELDPGCERYPEHDHASDGHEEVYVVLRGAVTLHAGGATRELCAGQLVRVAPAVRRKFVTKGEGAAILALGGTPGKAYEPSWGG